MGIVIPGVLHMHFPQLQRTLMLYSQTKPYLARRFMTPDSSHLRKNE